VPGGIVTLAFFDSALREIPPEIPGSFHAAATPMTPRPEDVQQLTKRIIGCAIEVHRALGPGLLESSHGECLLIDSSREASLLQR
jgi:hypothetical protein